MLELAKAGAVWSWLELVGARASWWWSSLELELADARVGLVHSKKG